ncbi:hypothetical protein [Streptomyces ossamyceticus]|uniref:hypothetical protein n=1 Tax=Streptomyces ossamyceticus TaxID=249581 RepID=UPI001F0AA0CB|nr:hypothetical protein [Streptomyces ossamyceticus]
MQKTTMDPPLTLGVPRSEPIPPDDCGVCAALAKARAAAKEQGDMSRVSDLNVEIRNHHEPRRKRRR